MKIRYDFVTNSSSTSFVIISDGEFNLKDFIKAVGITPDSPFINIYKSLFKSFKSDMKPISYNKEIEPIEKYLDRKFANAGQDLKERVAEAQKNGKTVYVGKLSSETNDIESFFCTDEFIIEGENFYINAQENGW